MMNSYNYLVHFYVIQLSRDQYNIPQAPLRMSQKLANIARIDLSEYPMKINRKLLKLANINEVSPSSYPMKIIKKVAESDWHKIEN